MNALLATNIIYLVAYLAVIRMKIGFIKSISNTFYMLKEKYGIKNTIPYFIMLGLPAITLTYSGYVFNNWLMVASGIFIFAVETFAACNEDRVRVGHYIGAIVGYGAMVTSFALLDGFWWWSLICLVAALLTIFVKKKCKVIYIEVVLYVLGIAGIFIYSNYIV